MTQEADRARELVARACRILGSLGLTKAATGHISTRTESGFLVRARGRDEVGVRYTTAGEVIACDRDGKAMEGPEGLSAPQEVYIHSEIYRARADVNCVVHVHPATVVLFTITKKKLLPIFGAYDPTGLRIIVEGPALYDRAVLIKNAALGRELADALGGGRICLMRGHGITTVGRTVEEATLAAIKINEVAEMNYQAYLLGDPEPISDTDIRTFLPDFGTRVPSPSPSREMAPLMGNLRSAWRYYSTLAGETEYGR